MKKNAFAIFLIFILIGCNKLPSQYPNSELVEVKEAKSVTVDIRIDAGNLFIIGSGKPFFLAQYFYNQPTRIPKTDYKEQDKKGYLLLTQQMVPSIGSFPLKAGSLNDWRFQFNDHVPMEMNVEFNRGEANLQLGTLDIKRLTIVMGEGNVKADLHQQKSKNMYVKINCAKGNLDLLLPKMAAVKIVTDRGEKLDSLEGFQVIDDGFVNQSFQEKKEYWLIDLKKSVGKINILQIE